MSIVQNERAIAEFPNEIRTVRCEQKRSVLTLYKKFILAFTLEVLVSNHDDFVDEVTIKFYR